MGAGWQVAAYASVNIEGVLHAAANDDGGPVYGLMLRGAVHW